METAVTAPVKRLLHRVPLLESKINESQRVEIKGRYEDTLVLIGRTQDHQSIHITGKPRRTDMSVEQFKEFVVSARATELEEESRQLEQRKREETIEGIELIPIKEIKFDRVKGDADDAAVVVERDLKGVLHLQTGRKRVEDLQNAKKELVEAEIRKELSEETKNELKKHEETIREEADHLRKITTKPEDISDIYFFEDAGYCVLHIGHIDLPLRDYGNAYDPLKAMEISGTIQIAPDRIDIGDGRRITFCTFDPDDDRELADGGQRKVTFLRHETLISLASLGQQSLQVGSMLKLTQEKKTLQNNYNALQRTLHDSEELIGGLRNRVRDLEKELGKIAHFNVSAAVTTIGVSCLSFGFLGLLLGILFAAAFPSQTTCNAPLYNVTTGLQTGCLREVVTSNPLGALMPGVGSIGGVCMGFLAALRHYRSQM